MISIAPVPDQSTERRLLWSMTAFFIALYGLMSLHSGYGPLGEDPAQYLLLAKALLMGEGYRDLCFPGHPPHVAYPFVFPLMLVPVVAVFGLYSALVHLPSFLCGAFIPVLVFSVVRKRERASVAALIAGWVGFAPLMVFVASRVTSDAPYCAASLIALLFFDRHLAYRRAGGTSRWLWLAVAWVMIAELTRTVGLALGGAITVSAWANLKTTGGRRDWGRILPVAGLVAGTLLLWFSRNAWLGVEQGSLYFSGLQLDPSRQEFVGMSLGKLWDDVRRGVQFYSFALVHGVIPAPAVERLKEWFWLRVALGGLCGVGWCARMRRPSLLEWYALLYCGVILMWPYHNARYFAPILPVLFYYLYVGVRQSCLWVVRGRPRAWPEYVPMVFVAVGVVYSAWSSIGMVQTWLRLPTYAPEEARMIQVHHWAREHLPQDVVIFSTAPGLTRYLSGRHAMTMPATNDAAAIGRLIAQHQLEYIVVNEWMHLGQEALKQELFKDRSRWDVLFAAGQSVLVQLRDPEGWIDARTPGE